MSLILVIEDDVHNRQLLRQVFECEGHSVTEAATGSEGLTAARMRLPRLIILDLMLPEMNGWDVCRQLKINPITRSIPVMIVTGNRLESDELRGWESGVDDYMTKPWATEQLLSAATRLLSAGKAA